MEILCQTVTYTSSQLAFDTPYTKELRTNYVPSALDREHIKALLIEPQKRLSALNDKISKVERTLDGLKRERDNLKKEIQEHARLLTPFRRLPDDVLSEIFLACLPDQHNATMRCYQAPLVLGLVCSRWRSLAYSTPSLWATLHVPCPMAMSYPPPTTPESRALIVAHAERLRKLRTAVTNWLLRSGACPLSISFSCAEVETMMSNTNNGEVVVADIRAYLDILLSFSHRWYSLALYIPSGKLFDCIASIPSTSIPELRHLRLFFSRTMPVAEGLEWSSSNLLHASKLHTLNVSFLPFHPSSISGNSWLHLSHLSLSSISPFSHAANKATIADAYAVFSRCKRLVHCSLDIFDRPDAISPSGSISLPFLKTLSIVESCQLLSTLFECFTDLTALRGVSYHTFSQPSNQRKSPLITLVARTNNQLSYLSTNFRYYILDDLHTIFGLVPNLTNFAEEEAPSRSRAQNLPESFDIEKVSLDLLTSQISLDDGKVYCPRLQILNLKKPQTLSDRDVVSFLQRRMGASSLRCPGAAVEPLKDFRVVFTHPEECDIPAQLSEYVAGDGPLRLTISRPRIRRRIPYVLLINPTAGIMNLNSPVPAVIEACL